MSNLHPSSLDKATILNQIVATKHQEVADMYARQQEQVFRDTGFARQRTSFIQALQKPGLSLIAELKKASPSKGIIRPIFSPIALAKTWENTAAALSVLTDATYFKGDPTYIPLVVQHVQTPVLRKDFVIDPIQLYQAKWLGASAVLLIKAILSDTEAMRLHTLALDLGLDVLFEVHAEEELHWALAQEEIRILGINARNLNHFGVDPEALYKKLAFAKTKRPECLVVAESGIMHTQELYRLSEMGVDAVLIGEGLAKNPELTAWFNQHEN